MAKNIIMTEGNVRNILIRMTVPMIFGMLGLIIFNLVDTFFVSMLGTEELAALSFTYPVVLILNSVTLGIGMGTASVVSRAVGEKDKNLLMRYVTDSLTLGVLIALIFMVVGLLTIEPVFKMLGADDNIIPIIVSYMRIWYIGTIFVVIPMIGNNSIRALGDTKIPSLIMIVAAVVNTIIDPILIFGWGPFPRLEVSGAAIATVISRMITFGVALYVLGKRERMISLKDASIAKVLDSWKKILYIGVPNAVIKVIQPVGVGIITALLASISMEAVAGFGIAAKVQRFALIIIGSLAVIMLPFIGQNFGAKKFDRIKKGIYEGYKIIGISSIIVYILLFIFAENIGRIFSDNVEVVEVFSAYLRIVTIFYTVHGLQHIGNSFFNAINQPIKGVMISFIQMFVVFVPLSILLSKSFGTQGVFISLGISYLVAGGIAHFMMKKTMKQWS